MAAGYLQKAMAAGIPSTEKSYADYLARMTRGDSLQALQFISSKDLNHPMLSRAYFAYQLPRMSHLTYQKSILAEIKKYPFDPVLIIEVGEFYTRLRNYKQALYYLNQIPKQSGLYKDALYNRALTYLNMGQKSRSLAILDSGQREFVSDLRFIQLRDRLLGKRVDSTAIKVDSTVQKSD
jgi:tetratricopeptide (TPR) repeat protein